MATLFDDYKKAEVVADINNASERNDVRDGLQEADDRFFYTPTLRQDGKYVVTITGADGEFVGLL